MSVQSLLSTGLRNPGGTEYFINVMIAATDFTEANGATRIIPGSHRWPADRQPGRDDPVERLILDRLRHAIRRRDIFPVRIAALWRSAQNRRSERSHRSVPCR
jgi:hypothetical protein